MMITPEMKQRPFNEMEGWGGVGKEGGDGGVKVATRIQRLSALV